MSSSIANYNGLVSVITASYNSASSIERCVRSVHAQTCEPLQHIVVDDGSTDRTPEVLADLAREIPLLTVIRQPNQGAGPARNAGIQAAEGRYIAFLDSDDVWLEDKLQNQLAFMERQRCEFSYGDYAIVDSDSEQPLGTFMTPARLGYRQLLTRCPIGCSTAAYNQELLGKCFMPAIRRGQDWGLWLALTRRGCEARKYPGCQVIYHRRKGSLSRRKVLKAKDMYRIYTVEEQIGRIPSAFLLARFAINVMTRRL
ncbi:MAG: glycosyltransferase family 2 protein [Woeseiaceae bacterium]|nr:glycosyltransferase family 2 protein [Woeseiaceae bacterium]